MGTLAEKLQYTKNAVEDIREAIGEKGISTEDYALGDYGNRIRAAITPPFNNGTINIPANFGKPVEWAESCVFEFEDGDIFVYNSGIGYNIYFTYEAKVFSAYGETSSGSQNVTSAEVKITTTASVDYAVRIMDIRPLNNRQVLLLWTHQLNAEGTNWAPFYAQVITLKWDDDAASLGVQLSSAVSLLPSGTHYVEGKEIAGVRAFLDMAPLKNDMNRIVELGLLLQKDTYTSAGVHSASVLYWNDIRVTTTQLALNSTAWTTLCSVAPSAEYNYLTHYRSNLYGWVYQYQTTSTNETIKLVARPDGRALNNFVNSNIRTGDALAKNSFLGASILGVLEDGNVLASNEMLDFTGDLDGSITAMSTSLMLHVNEYDQLKNEWSRIHSVTLWTSEVGSGEITPGGPVESEEPNFEKLILMQDNILLDTVGGRAWHIKRRELKKYSATYLGRFDVTRYEPLYGLSYQFSGLCSNKFFGIGQEEPLLPENVHLVTGNLSSLGFVGSFEIKDSNVFGIELFMNRMVKVPFASTKGSLKHAFCIENEEAVARRSLWLNKRITVGVRLDTSNRGFPFEINLQVMRDGTFVIAEKKTRLYKPVNEPLEAEISIDFPDMPPRNRAFYRGERLSLWAGITDGVNPGFVKFSPEGFSGDLTGYMGPRF